MNRVRLKDRLKRGRSRNSSPRVPKQGHPRAAKPDRKQSQGQPFRPVQPFRPINRQRSRGSRNHLRIETSSADQGRWNPPKNLRRPEQNHTWATQEDARWSARTSNLNRRSPPESGNRRSPQPTSPLLKQGRRSKGNRPQTNVKARMKTRR